MTPRRAVNAAIIAACAVTAGIGWYMGDSGIVAVCVLLGILATIDFVRHPR